MDHRAPFAIARRRYAVGVAVAALATAVGLAGCGGTAAPSAQASDTRAPVPVDGSAPTALSPGRLVVGTPEPGLSFSVPPRNDNGEVGTSSSGPAVPDVAKKTASTSPPTPAKSAAEAADAFGRAIVDGRTVDAFALLPGVEQTRIGSPTRFADVLSREPSWLSSALDETPALGVDVASIRISQTPMIDEIRGVVGPSAVVTLPGRKEADGWKVSWERRSVTQQFETAEQRASDDVLAWAVARQKACASPLPVGTAVAGEHAGGLLGALWLADELCAARGALSSIEVGDIYTLDDPQPLLDAFGSGAYQWARVVTLASPHAMHVIVAPLVDRWVVVGIAPVRSAT